MADYEEEWFQWAERDAFAMPVLPKSLEVDPVVAALLHVTAFLELSGDDAVHPDWAVEAMEHVAHYLQQLRPEQVETVRQQVARVTEHARQNNWGDEAVEFFDKFLENFGVDEGEE